MDKEIWKPVVGYEELYEVSNKGNVRSHDRIIHPVRYGKPYTRIYHGRTLHPHPNEKGYLRVNLTDKDGDVKYMLVHRLVAMAFIPNPEGKAEINHKDETKTNNCVENLEWCTHYENIHYGTAIERKKQTLKRLKESNTMYLHHRKGFVPKMDELKKWMKKGEKIVAKASDMEKISRALGVNPQTVRYGLEQGVFPFGTAIKCKKSYSYVFYPKLVKEYLDVEIGKDESED